MPRKPKTTLPTPAAVMEPLRFGPDSVYPFDPKLGDPDGPRSGIPRAFLQPDRLRALLTICRHLAIVFNEHNATIVGVFQVRSATETFPKWLITATRKAASRISGDPRDSSVISRGC